MMTSSSTGFRNNALAALIVAAAVVFGGVAGGTAHAGRHRVVILEFRGPNAEKFHADVVKLVRKQHTVVGVAKWDETADDLGAAKLNSKNVKKVARKLNVDGVIVGEIEKRRDKYILRLKVREGRTGDYTGNPIEASSNESRLDARATRDLRDELLDTINTLDPAVSADDEEEDDDRDRDRDRDRDDDEDRDRDRDRDRDEDRDDDRDDRDDRKAKDRDRDRDEDRDDDRDDDRDEDRSDRARSGFGGKGKDKGKDAVDEDRDRDRDRDDDRGDPGSSDGDDDENPLSSKDKDKAKGKPKDADKPKDKPKDKPRDEVAAEDDRDRDRDDDRAERADSDDGERNSDDDRDGDDRDRDRDRDDDDDRVASADDTDDEGEVRDRDDRDDDDGALDGIDPTSPENRAVDAAIGISVMRRRLTFKVEAGMTNRPLGYKGAPVAGLYVDADVYPLAFNKRNRSITKNLGISVLADRVLKINTEVDGMKLSSKQWRYGIGLAFRYPAGPVLLNAHARYTKMGFSISRGDGTVDVDVPNVGYTAYDLGAGVIYPMGKLAFGLEASFLLIPSTGSIQQREQYGAATVTGFDALLHADYLITSKIFARAAFHLTTIGFNFSGNGDQTTGRDGDAEQDVFGARDTYLGGSVTAGYLF